MSAVGGGYYKCGECQRFAQSEDVPFIIINKNTDVRFQGFAIDVYSYLPQNWENRPAVIIKPSAHVQVITF